MYTDGDRKLIYEWNTVPPLPPYDLKLNDETLRDGLQSPSIDPPSTAKKIEILHLMEELGIYSAALGIPAAGRQAYQDVLALAKEIADRRMNIRAYCAARTMESDIAPIVDISQKTGLRIQAALFIFSSPIRQYIEDWNVDELMVASEKAIRFAHDHGVPVMYATEDTTRSHPDTIKRLFTLAMELGVERLCISDTAGHATPIGARNVVSFVSKLVKQTRADVGIDWHGHRDRGFGVSNAVAAYFAGADRIHGSALGIGERVGNAAIDLIMVNFKLAGIFKGDLTKLPRYARTVSEACGIPIPDNYPVLGRDAFRTSAGVHAAAIAKAYRKGDAWLANRIYSGVPADMFGLEQIIEIGPMSGKWNVRHWLSRNNIPETDELVERILAHAKKEDHILSDAEILGVIETESGG